MECSVKIFSPKNGEYIKSKTFEAILNEVNGDIDYAKKLFAQTRTENFRAFFGDIYNSGESTSKVLTEEGEPLILFHGSMSEFDTFDLDRSREIGFHFGSKKAAIERSYPGGIDQFGTSEEDAFNNLKEENPAFNIKPFFLNIRNIIEGVDYLEADPEISNMSIPKEEYESLYKKGREKFGEEFSKLTIAFYQKGNITIEDVNKIFESGDKVELQKALGNPDGYWYINKLEGKGEKSYVVFDPKNIKSIYNNGDFSQDENTLYNINSETSVDFTLKVINALQKTPRKIYPSNSIQGFYNDLIKQGAPKNQIELLKDYILKNNIQEINVQDLITGLASEISYTIEINTTQLGIRTNVKSYDDAHDILTERGIYPDSENFHEKMQELTRDENEDKPSQYYSNLTVPGGTNYTENEIATPAIVPSIKGHAQFATNNGIGWFRSDEQITSDSGISEQEEAYYNPDTDEMTITDKGRTILGGKTRRILEVQSDIFQKGRDIKSPDEIINELKKSGELQIKCD